MSLCKIGMHKWIVKDWKITLPSFLHSFQRFRICSQCNTIQVDNGDFRKNWDAAPERVRGHIVERLMTVALLNNYINNLELEMKEKDISLDSEKQVLIGIKDAIIRGESYVFHLNMIV